MTYYSHTSGVPALLTRGVSSQIRTEFDLVQAGFTAAEAADVALDTAKAPKASPAFTGVPTSPTATTGTSSTQLATTAFVANTAFSSALPSQTGNSGKFVTTDGTNASWGTPPAGALVYLSIVTATAASTVDIETGFSSTYDDYLIIGYAEKSASDAIFCRWKFAGAYDTGTNYVKSSGLTASTTLIDGLNISSNTSTAKDSFDYKLFDANSTNLKKGYVVNTGLTSAPNIFTQIHGHTNVSNTTAIQGVRFYCSGGATITGTFKLYGIAKA